MVPGRTRLVGGVMFGGVGLTMANAEVEGVALTAPGPVRAHAPSVEARMALSARRPTDAVVISPPLAPAGYWTWSKFATQFYDRWRSLARSGGDLTHSSRLAGRSPSVTWAELEPHARRPVAAPCRRGGGGASWGAGQHWSGSGTPASNGSRPRRPAGARGSGGLRADYRRRCVEERADPAGRWPAVAAQPADEPRGRRWAAVTRGAGPRRNAGPDQPRLPGHLGSDADSRRTAGGAAESGGVCLGAREGLAGRQR